MKKQNGITIVSLVIYVFIMIIIIGVMNSIINRFYDNNNKFEGETQEIIEFNKFNTCFLKEIKKVGNSLDSIQDNYILFSSGNSFSFSNNAIYYNDIKVCTGVKEFKIEREVNEDGEDIDNILNVELMFKNYKKSIKYKIEEIY